jgi:hypothetical protein
MRATLKDNNCDPRCPINGRVSGIFLSAAGCSVLHSSSATRIAEFSDSAGSLLAGPSGSSSRLAPSTNGGGQDPQGPPAALTSRWRLAVPARVLLSRCSNVYFADFFCASGGGQGQSHYVVLALAKPGTAADEFCKTKLLRLDARRNPWLCVADKSPTSPSGELVFVCKMPHAFVQVNRFILTRFLFCVAFSSHRISIYSIQR